MLLNFTNKTEMARPPSQQKWTMASSGPAETVEKGLLMIHLASGQYQVFTKEEFESKAYDAFVAETRVRFSPPTGQMQGIFTFFDVAGVVKDTSAFHLSVQLNRFEINGEYFVEMLVTDLTLSTTTIINTGLFPDAFEEFHTFRLCIEKEMEGYVLVTLSIDNKIILAQRKEPQTIPLEPVYSLAFGRYGDTPQPSDVCMADVLYIAYGHDWHENLAAGKDGGSYPIYLVRVYSVTPSTMTDTFFPFRQKGSAGDPLDADSWHQLTDEDIGLFNGVFQWATNDLTMNVDSPFRLYPEYGTGTDENPHFRSKYQGGIIKKDGLGSLNLGVDISKGGNVAKVGGFTLNLLNTNRLSERLAQLGINLENRQIDVSLLIGRGVGNKKGISKELNLPENNERVLREYIRRMLLLGESFVIFRGIIQETSFTNESVSLRCIDSGFKRHQKIPKNVITPTQYPQASEKVLNKPIPMLFGEFPSKNYYEWNRFSKKVYSPPFLQVESNKFIVAGHGIEKKLDATIADSLFNLESIAAVYVNEGWTDVYNYQEVGLFKFERDDSAKKEQGVYNTYLKTDVDTTVVRAKGKKTGTAFIIDDANNYSPVFYQFVKPDYYVLDGDHYSGSSIDNQEGLQEFTMGKYPAFKFLSNRDFSKSLFFNNAKDNGIPGDSAETIGKLAVGLLINAVTETDLGVMVGFMYNPNSNEEGKYCWRLLTFTLSVDSDPDVIGKLLCVFDFKHLNITSDYTGNGTLTDEELKDSKNFFLSNVEIRLQVRSGIVRAGGVGLGFPFDVSASNVPYTVANQQGRGFGDSKITRPKTGVISAPQDIIESLFRDSLDLDDFEINTESIDSVGRNWLFANAVVKQKNSIDIIKEICEQSALIQFTDRNDREKVVCLKAMEADDVSKLPIITTDDGFDFEVGKTALNDVYNQFEVQYLPDSITGEFNASRIINEDVSELTVNNGLPYQRLCQKSQAWYRTQNKLVFEAPWIQDDATAMELVKWLALFLHRKRYTIEFKAMLNVIHYELGDFARFDHPLLDVSESNRLKRVFILTEIKFTPNKDQLSLTWEELPSEQELI